MLAISFSFFFITLFVLFLKYREILNPPLVVISFYYALLILSLTKLTVDENPSEIAVFYILVSLLFMLLGMLFGYSPKIVQENKATYKNYDFFCGFFILFCLIPVLIMFVFFISDILSNYPEYVAKVRFSKTSGPVHAFPFLTAFNDIFIRPASRVAAIIGVAFFLYNKSKKMFILSLIVIIINSVIYVKRIDIAYLISIVMAGYICIGINRSFLKKIKINHVVLFLLIVYVVYLISFLRSRDQNVFMIFMHSGIAYHTFGVFLFDYALNNSSSYLHDFVFPGESIFSSFGFILRQVLKAFGIDYSSQASFIYHNELGEFVTIGYNSLLERYSSPNAFYTSLYPIYRDFKLFGFILFPFIYGFIFSSAYLTFKKHRTLSSLIWVIFFAYLGYASVLTPILMSNSMWLVPIAIALNVKWKFSSFIPKILIKSSK